MFKFYAANIYLRQDILKRDVQKIISIYLRQFILKLHATNIYL